jgi:hypothetical protein
MTDQSNQDDQDDILNDPTDVTEESTANVAPPVDPVADVIDEDDTAPADAPAEANDEDNVEADDEDEDAEITSTTQIQYDDTLIELRGGSMEEIEALLQAANDTLGYKALDADVRTTGSWANILYRMRMDPNFEEIRSQKAISLFSPEQRAILQEVAVDDNGKVSFKASVKRNEDGKIVLRTSRLNKKLSTGERKTLTGQAALLAFETEGKGGGWRVPLYNSGLTIDILAPTGNDFQTMLYNCSILDREMGSRLGAHYFTYSDVMFKTQILNFIQPLIIGSSFADWQKRDKLFAIIKLPDLAHIVATIAAICYPNGYPDFVVTCKQMPDKEKGIELCGHSEKLTADIMKLIVTRFSSMSPSAIEHMTAARTAGSKHNASQIAKYQADLGFEGEKLTFGKVSFTMRIPSLTEHLEAGAQFLADIVNEIDGDNKQGREEQVGIRYMRTFVPWIDSVEKELENGSTAVTSDVRTIIRALENLDLDDPTTAVRQVFEDYIGRVQLTYVGHPILPCTKCGHTAETPSGMWTFDPFSTFFTLAFLYLRPSDSSETKTDLTNT